MDAAAPGHAHASPEVAAATAAYVVLRHYFPNSAAALTVDYEAALAEIPNGVGKVHGILVGDDAAAALIARHPEDGISAPCPNPTTNRSSRGSGARPRRRLPMAATWLGFVDPLVLDSPTSIPLRRSARLGQRPVRRRLRRGPRLRR